ncbi:hypothetical protein BCR44DRAFT_1426161 [Catenaria anguillulae PL171]|uniref:Uncharacterized protein n=1 Tax=Catenaria anguillulae PL171 TaxID=765915 RepID=A0A1Y2H9U0_9FUNG|nr:hypothetical protein BCR44DRAFT_1447721 [Catenaria anguillulae PL171]ORZ30225.1 hypothetical protein BCR44DRAFT_1445878 [Catenaria anguillulae PL171]ORZ30300.1 hypothetical protein BCR44DRAFT_1445299 [Catenaria anguillulae PL171]ORZ33511.1 hypothetical protein BCR44DRAFT_1438117 [Catenaria anguillulae PL171]ORZ34662.1 hypothetical protein BCR44DRAFT_1436173 [Catenaria anguillulae PL171]
MDMSDVILQLLTTSTTPNLCSFPICSCALTTFQQSTPSTPLALSSISSALAATSLDSRQEVAHPSNAIFSQRVQAVCRFCPRTALVSLGSTNSSQRRILFRILAQWQLRRVSRVTIASKSAISGY